MKKIIAVLFALVLMPAFALAGSYEELSSKLSEAGSGLKGQKIVIIPFKTGSGLPEYAGSVAAHRLNVKLTQDLFYDVVSPREFAEADNWVAENGNPNKNSALQLMERLNAQLAITGEVKKKDDASAEIKVKLIKPSEKKTFAVISEEIPNDWPTPRVNNAAPAAELAGNVAENASNTVTPMESYAQPSRNYSHSLRSNDYMFFDLFYGMMNNAELNMEFKNDSPNISAGELGVSGVGGYHSKFELRWAEAKGTGPIGLRVGFFADMLGLDFGLRYHSYETKKQSVDTNFTGVDVDLPNKYAKLSIYEMNVDLLLRFIKTYYADAYIGFGIGMSLMDLDLPHVKSYHGSNFKTPTDEFGVGMSFRIPLGARWKVSDSMHIVTEISYEAATNMSDFTRDIKNEKDSYILSGVQAIAGIGFVF